MQSCAPLFYRLPRAIQHPLERWWYERLSSVDRNADMILMNYGWASLDSASPPLALRPEDEPNRYCIQLYQRVASAVDLKGLDVLEVGCGRGGGAASVMRYLAPRSLVGLDLTANAIAFCSQHYCLPGLSFVRGRAEALEFVPETFDAVLNVESSHCYADMGAFLAGVYRVLKPGGVFLYADHRPREAVDLLDGQLAGAGLKVVERENINAHVMRALELDNARKQALIQRRVPRVLRPFFNEFAAMEGTESIYARLKSGEQVYQRFVLQK